MDTLQNLFWLLAFGIGGIAAYLDWKGKIVHNSVWIYGLALATPLLIWEGLQSPRDFLLRLLFAVIWTSAMYGLWRGRAFGGADMKGFALFGLLLSPVGYYEPMHGKFFPAMDILVASLLIGELLRRILRERTMPLFTVSQWPLLLAPVAGGLVWWPIVGLVRLIY